MFSFQFHLIVTKICTVDLCCVWHTILLTINLVRFVDFSVSKDHVPCTIVV